VPSGNPLLVTELSLSQAVSALIAFQSFMAGSAVAVQTPTPRTVADSLHK
jgi:hypothetical protein